MVSGKITDLFSTYTSIGLTLLFASVIINAYILLASRIMLLARNSTLSNKKWALAPIMSLNHPFHVHIDLNKTKWVSKIFVGHRILFKFKIPTIILRLFK